MLAQKQVPVTFFNDMDIRVIFKIAVRVIERAIAVTYRNTPTLLAHTQPELKGGCSSRDAELITYVFSFGWD